MTAARLADRGVVKLSGEDAKSFLNGLVTMDVMKLVDGGARYGALLTPQGKIVADFLVTESGGDLYLDCPRALAAPLATKLGFYKLRAKVTVENLSDRLAVIAMWDSAPAALSAIVFADPRDARLGHRVLIPLAEVDAFGAEIADAEAYRVHRIACGVPDGGVDFGYNDAFPHEANMDRLHGVDFDKGCYVGQEVVSRMQHRGTARTRIVCVALDGAAPAPGAAITAGDKTIGTLGSSAGHSALALMRLDRAADAIEAGLPFSVSGIVVTFLDVNDLRLPPKHQTVA